MREIEGIILFKRATAAKWKELNPILMNGEPGLETDTNKIKIGDGNTAWNNLIYSNNNKYNFSSNVTNAHIEGCYNGTTLMAYHPYDIDLIVCEIDHNSGNFISTGEYVTATYDTSNPTYPAAGTYTYKGITYDLLNVTNPSEVSNKLQLTENEQICLEITLNNNYSLENDESTYFLQYPKNSKVRYGRIINIYENKIIIDGECSAIHRSYITKGATFPFMEETPFGNIFIGGGTQGDFIVQDFEELTSHSEGTLTISTISAHAEGYGSQALSVASHAEGENSRAIGFGSHAEGATTTAIGHQSHSEGELTRAEGYAAHAEGQSTKAIGSTTHAEGNNTIASGRISHAEGNNTQALGNYTHTEGHYTEAKGMAAHAEGSNTKSYANYGHTEGYNTQAIYNEEGLASYGAHAEGNGSIASNEAAHAEGKGGQASGLASHAEGQSTKAMGLNSHAEGYGSIAKGPRSHAEGQASETAEGADASHAEGFKCHANAKYAHAEGYQTEANGMVSHAEGRGTIAQAYQHVEGKWNTNSPNAIHIVGNGTGPEDENRSNAYVLDKYGNGTYSGKVKAGAQTTDSDDDLVLVTKGYLKSYITEAIMNYFSE